MDETTKTTRKTGEAGEAGEAETTSPPASRMHPGWWISLLVLLLTVAVLRARLLEMPLERDEGEYAFAGQLLRQGVSPYAEAYNMKLPGVYVAYAALMSVFGESIRGIHIGLLFVNAATIGLLFLLGRRLLSPLGGLAAAAAFAMLTLNPASHGLSANAEHFVVPFAAGGLLLLLGGIEKGCGKALALSGLCFGVGVLMKQQGAAFLLAGGMALVIAEVRRLPRDRGRILRRAAIFAVAGLLPYLFTCLALGIAGVFDTFWFWTFTYARSYGSQVPWSAAWMMFSMQVVKVLGQAPLLWSLAAIGLTTPWWSRVLRPHGATVMIFALLSGLAICPGLFFREHYFLLLGPAGGLLAAAGTGALVNLARRRTSLGRPALVLAGIVFVAALAEPVIRQRELLFRLTPVEACRATFGLNPFPESVAVAKVVASLTDEGERIAVIGSEPQIYFLAKRRSATGYIYTYALMEPHEHAARMHREMIAEIEAHRPKVLVLVNIQQSWLAGAWSKQILQRWFAEYVEQYDFVWLAEIGSDGTRQWRDGEAARIARDGERLWVAVLERKD
jgi:hypothetical protein